jgi:DNA invertase Pin-like site-specific DNA recombinase
MKNGRNKRADINNQAVGYIRVSTDKQADLGVSLESQHERLQAYCDMQGLELASIIREEGVSASIALSDRPGGGELLTTLRKGVQHVLAIKLDRLFRNAEDCLRQTAEWDRQGVTLHVLDMGGSTMNTASAMGRMFLTLTAAFAELERNLIAERTTSALAFKKQHRQAYNHTPFGFDRAGDMLTPNPSEQAVIARVKQQREAGNTLAAIAASLNADSVPTKVQGKWYPSTVSNVLAASL